MKGCEGCTKPLGWSQPLHAATQSQEGRFLSRKSLIWGPQLEGVAWTKASWWAWLCWDNWWTQWSGRAFPTLIIHDKPEHREGGPKSPGPGCIWHRGLWTGHSTAKGQEVMGDTQSHHRDRKSLKEAAHMGDPWENKIDKQHIPLESTRKGMEQMINQVESWEMGQVRVGRMSPYWTGIGPSVLVFCFRFLGVF